MLYLNINNVTFTNSPSFQFNFNKCCIWIKGDVIVYGNDDQFNFNKCCIWINVFTNSSLVAAVFNFNKCCIWIQKLDNLFD